MRDSVLVVEDDIDIRDSLREVLEVEGYQVEVAANGREALTALDNGRLYCVIVLDLMMPVMNGWEFIAAKQQRNLSTPIVVVTAAGESSVPGTEAFLRKPIDLEALLSVVRSHCPG